MQSGPKTESFSEAILSSSDISSLLLSWCQSSYFRKGPTALLNLWWFPARQIWKLPVASRTIQHIISALCLSPSFMIVYYWRRSGNYGTWRQNATFIVFSNSSTELSTVCAPTPWHTEDKMSQLSDALRVRYRTCFLSFLLKRSAHSNYPSTSSCKRPLRNFPKLQLKESATPT